MKGDPARPALMTADEDELELSGEDADINSNTLWVKIVYSLSQGVGYSNR